MPDYNNSKIYKIYNPYNNNIYIGSTTKKNLNDRFSQHKNTYITKSDRYKSLGNINEWKCELIENYKCNSKEELRYREQHYINLYDNCINKQRAHRSDKEKREQILKAHKNHYIKNSNIIKCECGAELTQHNLYKHLQRKIHFKNLSK